MKRFTLIAMVFALVLAVAGGASAAELKVRGQVQAFGNGQDNWDFTKSKSVNNNFAYEDDFTIDERARLYFDFIANENLKFVLQLQVGNGRWGQDGFALGQGDARTNTASAVRTRQAYLDFNLPDTLVNVKAGYMTVTLPGYVGGSAILDDEAGALLVSAPIIDKTLSVLVGYMRLMDNTNANNTNNAVSGTGNGYGMRDEFDAAVLALPIKLDGIEAVPFFVYGWAGKDALNDAWNSYTAQTGATTSATDTNRIRGLLSPGLSANTLNGIAPLRFQKDISAWWLGLTGKVTMFDPIWFAAGFNYGSLSGGGTRTDTTALGAPAVAPWDSSKVNDRAGWLADFAIGYTGLDMVKPKVWFAYSSGEDSDPTNGSERMPMLSNYLKYTPFWFGNSVSSSSGTMIGNVANANERAGFWALGLTLEKITFMDKLSQDFYFAYIKGTNSKSLLTDPNMPASVMAASVSATSGAFSANAYKPGQFLTTKDSLFEFDLNTTYKIYEELSAIVELGYIVQSIDKDTWNTYYNLNGGTTDRTFKFSDAMKVMFGLSYDF